MEEKVIISADKFVELIRKADKWDEVYPHIDTWKAKAEKFDKLIELIDESYEIEWDLFDIGVSTVQLDALLGTSYKNRSEAYREQREVEKAREEKEKAGDKNDT